MVNETITINVTDIRKCLTPGYTIYWQKTINGRWGLYQILLHHISWPAAVYKRTRHIDYLYHLIHYPCYHEQP